MKVRVTFDIQQSYMQMWQDYAKRKGMVLTTALNRAIAVANMFYGIKNSRHNRFVLDYPSGVMKEVLNVGMPCVAVGESVTRTIVDIHQAALEELCDWAKEEGLTVSHALYNALLVAKTLQDYQDKGVRLLRVENDERFYEITL